MNCTEVSKLSYFCSVAIIISPIKVYMPDHRILALIGEVLLDIIFYPFLSPSSQSHNLLNWDTNCRRALLSHLFCHSGRWGLTDRRSNCAVGSPC